MVVHLPQECQFLPTLPPQKLTVFRQAKLLVFPTFYGTPVITTMSTTDRLQQRILFQIPAPRSFKICKLFSHLRLGLPSGHFPSGFPTKFLCVA